MHSHKGLTVSAIRVVDGLGSLVHSSSRRISAATEVVRIEVARVASAAEPLVVVALPTLRIAEDLVGRGQLSERLVRRVDIVGVLKNVNSLSIIHLFLTVHILSCFGIKIHAAINDS